MREPLKNILFLRHVIDASVNGLKRIWAFIVSALGILLILRLYMSYGNQISVKLGIPEFEADIIFFLMMMLVFLAFGYFYYAKREGVNQLAYSAIKRGLYNASRSGLPMAGATELSAKARFLINPNFWRFNIVREDQRQAIGKILDDLRAHADSRFYVIEAESGAGKTAMPILLMDKLLSVNEFNQDQVADKVLYFDFAATKQDRYEEWSNISAATAGSQTSGSFLVLDNFHRIPLDELQKFTANIINNIHQMPWRALLILTQPASYFAQCPKGGIKLLQVAKENDVHFTLDDLHSEALRGPIHDELFFKANDIFDARDIQENDPLRWMLLVNIAGALQMSSTAGQSLAQRILDLHEAQDLEQLLKMPDFQKLVETLAAVSALAIHRGVVPKSEMAAALEMISGRTRHLWFVWSRLGGHYAIFRQLLESGIIIKAVTVQNNYIFHDRLAQHFKDFLGHTEAFKTTFRKMVDGVLARQTWFQTDELIRWLFAVELKDVEKIHAGFAKAVFSGAYKNMLKVMKRNDIIAGVEYERGLLAERVGNLEGGSESARSLLKRAEQSAPSPQLKALASISLIEAEHGDDAPKQLRAIIRDETLSDLVHLAAHYWLIHLESHKGRFASVELEEALASYTEHFKRFQEEDPFVTAHLGRRLYFDRLRYFYLEGSGDVLEYARLSKHACRISLQRHSGPSFSAYDIKFREAHFLHYEVLFRFGVLEQAFSDDDIRAVPWLKTKVGKNNQDMHTVAQNALKKYREAISAFDVFGDKTSDYIKPRVYEVRLILEGPTDDILGELYNYRVKMQKLGFDELEPYPDIYFFKFHILKALDSLTLSSDEGIHAFNEERQRALHHITAANRKFRDFGNIYGRHLCLLFHILANMSEQRQTRWARPKLVRLMKSCKREGHLQFVRAIEALVKRPIIGALDRRRIYQYVPFVHM